MIFSFSRPTPAAPPAATQPTAQGGSAPPRRHGAMVQAACNDCARLGAQKFPWPASLWEPRGPEGKTVQRYARRLASQAVRAPPTLISEPGHGVGHIKSPSAADEALPPLLSRSTTTAS